MLILLRRQLFDWRFHVFNHDKSLLLFPLILRLSALRLLVQERPLSVFSNSLIVPLPLCHCALAAHTDSFSGPPVLTDCYPGVHAADYAPQRHRAYALSWDHFLPLSDIDWLLFFCELQLKVVAVGPVGVENNLLLVSGGVVLVFGDLFEVELPTVLLQFLAVE